MGRVRREHLLPIVVETGDIIDEAVTKEKIAAKTLQSGSTSVSFPFAGTGEENVSASISFPTAFDAAPAVIASVEGINVGIVSIAATATGFTITVRDDKGTDYTTAQTATVRWIAIKI